MNSNLSNCLKLKLFLVRAFAHGAMGLRINPSWSGSSQCSTTGVSCLWDGAYKREPLLLIEKSSPCGSSGLPLSLPEWSFTICLMSYNRKLNVLSVSLNKTFPSFIPSNYFCQSDQLQVMEE